MVLNNFYKIRERSSKLLSQNSKKLNKWHKGVPLILFISLWCVSVCSTIFIFNLSSRQIIQRTRTCRSVFLNKKHQHKYNIYKKYRIYFRGGLFLINLFQLRFSLRFNLNSFSSWDQNFLLTYALTLPLYPILFFLID